MDLFPLNYEPMPTVSDGDVDCFALMDATSLFILSSMMVKCGTLDSSIDEFGQLFQSAYSHKKVWPQRLMVPNGLHVSPLKSEAESRGIKVVPVKKGDILAFTRETCQFFKAQFRSGLG